MSRESRRIAGVLLVILPTVMIGGVSLSRMVIYGFGSTSKAAKRSPRFTSDSLKHTSRGLASSAKSERPVSESRRRSDARRRRNCDAREITPSPERDSIQTLVATKRGGEWRFAAFQNTRVRPIGRDAAGTFVWILSDWLWKVISPKEVRLIHFAPTF